MNEPEKSQLQADAVTNSNEWTLESAQNAYGAIAALLEHIQISGLIIASLAHAIGEEKLKEIVQSEPWQLYMSSKRQLEAARSKIRTLTELIERNRPQQPE